MRSEEGVVKRREGEERGKRGEREVRGEGRSAHEVPRSVSYGLLPKNLPENSQ